ncbi:unnamed protein product [Ectocarpus sp. CCAP 1310/34]|nr:unnamed protein product [Ectocarpus sp. CCAP 1310/34]
MRGTSVFYANSSSVANELPLAVTGLVDMITVVLAGKKKRRPSDLGRLLGARKSMIKDTINYMLKVKLVVSSPLAKYLPFSEESLDSYSEDGAIPKVLLDSILTSNDPLNVRASVSSSYVRDSNEIGTEKVNLSDDSSPTSSSSDEGSELDAEAALRRGRPPPGGTSNALVVPHGEILDDSNNNSAWVEGFMHAFPGGCGGPLCPTRRNPVSFNRWIQILLNRGDIAWRVDRCFLCCAAAIRFRHEAISNVRFKLSVRPNSTDANAIASITKEDLHGMADELKSGKRTSALKNNRPEIRALFRKTQAVSGDATWTDHGKHRVLATAHSMFIQFGLPFFWMTANPSDVNSPCVMQCGEYRKRLDITVNDPVASATFFHETMEAVVKYILRFGAKDGDGGALGNIKAYIGMTEEQHRLMLHGHLMVWVHGFTSRELRDDIGRSLKKHAKLARVQEVLYYIGRLIYNQVMSLEEVEFSLLNASEPVYNNVMLPNASPFDEGIAQQNQSDVVSAEEWPEPLHTREAWKDERKDRMDYRSLGPSVDLASALTESQPMRERGGVNNGKAVIYSDGTLEIDGVRVEVDGPNDQTAALRLQGEILRASAARAKAVEDNVPFEDDDDDFIIRVRRGSTHINSYNWVVQQAIRSNMDIRVRRRLKLR